MNPSKLIGFKELIVMYDIFFIDLWGVIHNGKKIFVLGSDEEVNSRAIEIFRKKYSK